MKKRGKLKAKIIFAVSLILIAGAFIAGLIIINNHNENGGGSGGSGTGGKDTPLVDFSEMIGK